MEKVKIQRLLREAKHSTALLVGVGGSAASKMLLRWPDAFSAYVYGDDEMLEESLGSIIVDPIIVLTRAYAARVGTEEIVEQYIKEALQPRTGASDVSEIKNQLITICNMQIYALKRLDSKIDVQPIKVLE